MFQEWLKEMSELVKENLERIQSKHQVWYDGYARLLEIQKKLLGKWQGLYLVITCINNVIYEINMHIRRTSKENFSYLYVKKVE